MTNPRLMIVIASTRPGRVGAAVGEWFVAFARRFGGFEIDVVDLAELNLPFMDEPNHPRLQQYVHQHTKDWSARVAAADAFVFITPEYNFGFSAPLKNAIDYLHNEWNYKPLGFVSYGGVSAGTRAVQMLKQVVTALKMTPVNDAVYIPFVSQFIHDGRFEPNETTIASAEAMLTELRRHALVLPALRPQAAAV